MKLERVFYDSEDGIVIDYGDGDVFPYDEDEAREIARRCNVHDEREAMIGELVAALEAVRGYRCAEMSVADRAKVVAALAKAKGESQ